MQDQYSVDMIRLQVDMHEDQYEFLMKGVLKVELNTYVKYHQSFKFNKMKHNHTYDDNIHNFYIGYESNIRDKVSDPVKTLIIEYNPNKNPITGKLHIVLEYLVNAARSEIIIKGCDVAIDLKGIKRENVYVDKRRYQSFREHFEKGSLTHYIGQRGWGSTKIYDKAKEQKLEDEDWTRIEYTIKLGIGITEYRGLKTIPMSLPEIYVLDYSALADETIDIKTRCMLYALQTGYARIDEFNRRQKNTLKELAARSSEKIYDDSIKPQIAKAIQLYLEQFALTFNIEVLPF